MWVLLTTSGRAASITQHNYVLLCTSVPERLLLPCFRAASGWMLARHLNHTLLRVAWLARVLCTAPPTHPPTFHPITKSPLHRLAQF